MCSDEIKQAPNNIPKCTETIGRIKYIMNASDVVIEGDQFIRIKRKYGKFKRPVYAYKP